MRIEKGKLCIRSATTKDAKQLCKWWNDGTVMAHAGFPNGLGTTEKEIQEKIKKDNAQNQRLILEYEKKAIGEMSYRTTQEKVAQIGIKICEPNMQDQGLGTEYLKMLIGYIFIQMQYEKITLDTNLKNKRAQYVYEKLGFNKIRINKNAWKDQLGKMQSSVDYELKKEEYFST